jgi:hypothetical protein
LVRKNRVLKNQKGLAMLSIIGIMMVLTIIGLGLSAVALNDLSLSARTLDRTKALHVAEAGIQRFLWQLEKQGNNPEPTNFTLETSEGKALVEAERLTESYLWEVTSLGTTGSARRKIKVTVLNLSYWDIFTGFGEEEEEEEGLPTRGNGLNGTASISGALYIYGNIQLSGNSLLEEGPIFIKEGSLVMQSASAQVGSPEQPVRLYIEPKPGFPQIMNSQEEPIDPFNPQPYDLHVASIKRMVPEMPNFEFESMSEYRAIAAMESTEIVEVTYPGIVDPREYKVIDNDDSDNQSFSLDISDNTQSFGLKNGTAQGDFAWDKALRRLYIEGTVYVDGDVKIGDKNETIIYFGRGTIIANGEITIKGKLLPPNGEGGYPVLSEDNVLGLGGFEIEIETQSNNSNPDKNNPDIAAALFAPESVEFEGNNISFVGNVITGVLDFEEGANNHLFNHANLSSYVPPSLPGSGTYLALIANWREIK